MMDDKSKTDQLFRTLVWGVFAVLILISLLMQVQQFRHVGSFWRDEISTLALVNKPTIVDVYNSLEIDSYPPLYVVMLRGWKALGLGGSELGLRVFGFLALPFIIAATMLAFRLGGGASPPLVAIALLAFNPNVFYWSTALRAYGVASGLIILFFGSVLALIRRPSRIAMVSCFLLAVLCVQSNYQNSYLIFAVSMGAIGVSLVRRTWSRAALIMGAGIVAAISLTPYIPSVLRVREVDMLSRSELSLGFVLGRITEAFSNQQMPIAVIWYSAAFGLMFIPLALGFYRKWQGVRNGAFDTEIFIFLTTTIAAVTLLIFVKSVGYATMPWQYLPFMALIACLMELLLQRMWVGRRGETIRCVIALAVVLVGIIPVWRQAHLRRTNMDIIANTLAPNVGIDDLVVLSPFYMAVSYGYHGRNVPAEWTSLPPISASGLSFPFPDMKAAMTSTDPIKPVLDSVSETLKRGGRVWLVGNFDFLPPGQIPPLLLPAPDPLYGWSFGPYVTTWSMQLGHLIQTHATQAENVPTITGIPVFQYENLQLIIISGWQ